jgi:hypothetical protein
LHAVERAFIQQKQQYEDALMRANRTKDEELRRAASELETKCTSLTARLNATEQNYSSAQAELAQLREDSEKQLQKQREAMASLGQEMESTASTQIHYHKDLKEQLWNRELELRGARERSEQQTQQLEEKKLETIKLKSELAHCKELEEQARRDLQHQNTSWQHRWEDQESDLQAKHDEAVRSFQLQRERLTQEKRHAEQQVQEQERQISQLQSEMHAFKTSARMNMGSLGVKARGALTSPVWSEDLGDASPVRLKKGLFSEEFGASIESALPLEPLKISGNVNTYGLFAGFVCFAWCQRKRLCQPFYFCGTFFINSTFR